MCGEALPLFKDRLWRFFLRIERANYGGSFGGLEVLSDGLQAWSSRSQQYCHTGRVERRGISRSFTYVQDDRLEVLRDRLEGLRYRLEVRDHRLGVLRDRLEGLSDRLEVRDHRLRIWKQVASACHPERRRRI